MLTSDPHRFSKNIVKCSCSVVSNSLRPHGLNTTGYSIHGIFQARVLEWVAIRPKRKIYFVLPPQVVLSFLWGNSNSVVESSDKRGPLEKEMANHFSILALRTTWTVWRGEKIGHLKMNFPCQYVPHTLLEYWRNNSRKNEEMEPKQKQHPVVNVTGDESKSNAIKKITA